MMGYSVVYWFDTNKAEDAFAQTVQPISGKEDYVLLKMPLSLPYQTDWATARKANGIIRQGDVHYRMISQKLVNDTLYTVCKIDQSANKRFSKLSSHINEHVSEKASDMSKKSSSQLLKNFLKEYMASDKKHLVFIIDWLEPRQNTFHVFTPEVRSVDTQSPPPRHC